MAGRDEMLRHLAARGGTVARFQNLGNISGAGIASQRGGAAEYRFRAALPFAPPALDEKDGPLGEEWLNPTRPGDLRAADSRSFSGRASEIR